MSAALALPPGLPPEDQLEALRRRPWPGPAPISQHAIAQAAARHGIRPDFVDAARALHRIAARRGATLLRQDLHDQHPMGPRQLWLVVLCDVPVRVVLALHPAPIIVTVLPAGTCISHAGAQARARKHHAGRSADPSHRWRQARRGAALETDLEDP